MLVNLKEILKDTRSQKYAVGSFNVYSYETIKGVFECIRETGNPAIIAFGEKYIENFELENVFQLVRYFDKGNSIPIALHLDHCKDIKNIYKAAKAGFTSLMYDGSSLDFEENIKNTRHVSDFAHACDISVEAELGSIAAGLNSHEGEESDSEIYTNPEKAAEYIERTGVDALAVSIGTVHGLYKGTPKIRVDILEKIKNKVEIPLVLHGGSGTPENIILDCIKNGICKINVNTEISESTINQIRNLLDSGQKLHLSTVAASQVVYVKDVVTKYSKLFKN